MFPQNVHRMHRKNFTNCLHRTIFRKKDDLTKGDKICNGQTHEHTRGECSGKIVTFLNHVLEEDITSIERTSVMHSKYIRKFSVININKCQ